MISKLRGLKFIEIYSVSVKCSKIRGLNFPPTVVEYPTRRESGERREGGRQATVVRREGVSQLTLPIHPTVVTSLMCRRFVYMNKFMLLRLPIVLYK